MSDSNMSEAAQAHALFSTFVMGLASATLVELGQLPDPSSQSKRVQIASARQHLELLAMLEQKTRGNLTPEERDLLQRVLTDLRFQFAKVQQDLSEKSKSGGGV